MLQVWHKKGDSVNSSSDIAEAEIFLPLLKTIHESASWTNLLRIEVCKGVAKSFSHELEEISVDVYRAALSSCYTTSKLPILSYRFYHTCLGAI